MPEHLAPDIFAKAALGLNTYPWQEEVLAAVGRRYPCALLAINGSGKSSTVICSLILWFLAEFPAGRAVITSGSWSQLKAQVFDSLRRFSDLQIFKGWEFLDASVRTPQGGFAIGISVDEAFKAEGYHQRPGSPVLLVIDEGKAVSDGVFQSFAKCSPTYRLITSSAGPSSGRFHRIYTLESDYWWKPKSPITWRHCPHLSSQQRLADLEIYGESSTFYRNRWESEFASDSGEVVIPLDSLRACQASPPPWIGKGHLSAFCDFAGAGDESALALANGNQIELLDHWRHRLTTVSTGRFLNHFRRLNLQSHQISGDQGFGYQLMDVMQESGYFLHRCNNNDPAQRSDVFCNQSAEWWSNFATLVARKALILPNNEALLHQLASRRKEYDSKGRVKLEPKEDMRGRGLPSCDLADAVIGACMTGWGGLPSSLNPAGNKWMREELAMCVRDMERNRPMFYTPFVDFSR